MAENIEQVKKVVALCDDFMSSKILFADKKISALLESIAGSNDVYGLLDECLSSFNREKEFDRAFAINPMGKGIFAMPKEEFKVLSLVFCLLADIGSGKVSFDEIVGGYFVNEDGKKDYHKFMDKVILPFRNIIADTFKIVEEKEEKSEEEPFVFGNEEREDIKKGSPKFVFEDKEDLAKTFETIKSIASQMLELLGSDRKRARDNADSIMILKAVDIACEKANFDLVVGLVLGLKYSLKGNKYIRFFNEELQDIVEDRIEIDD